MWEKVKGLLGLKATLILCVGSAILGFGVGFILVKMWTSSAMGG